MPESHGPCTTGTCDGQRGHCFTSWCTCGCHSAQSEAPSPASDGSHPFYWVDDSDECGTCGHPRDAEIHSSALTHTSPVRDRYGDNWQLGELRGKIRAQAEEWERLAALGHRQESLWYAADTLRTILAGDDGS